METLKKNYEFKIVLAKGKSYYGKVLKVYIKSNGKDRNRIGIAIQKKIGKAIVRNKIKRWIREAYRKIEPQLEQGYDIIFLCKNKESVERMDFTTIKNDLEFILNRGIQ